MTLKEIKKIKQELYEILKKETTSHKKFEQLRDLAGKTNAPIPPGIHSDFPIDAINAITHNIHNILQTEMMFNACTSAKRSCMWAAIAAIVSLVILLVTCFLG